jgi:hypothetical protein
MVNKKNWLGILVMVLVFGMTVVGCNPDDDSKGSDGDSTGSDGDSTGNGPSQLFGSWSTGTGTNVLFVVIASDRITHTYVQPGTPINGSFSITVSNWESVVNEGENKSIYPSGFKVSGTVVDKNGTIDSINNGDAITRTYYLNAGKNKMVFSSNSNVAVLERY